MPKSPNNRQASRTKEIILENAAYLGQMANKHNYHLSERNGQRIFGPPKGEPPLNLNYQHELFITNIPINCFENTLLDIFLKVDGLYTFRYMLDYHGGGRGFAFAKYKTITNANFARIRINRINVMGQHLRVVSCKNKGILVIGNLNSSNIVDCGGRKDSVLHYCLATFGTIVRVKIKRNWNSLLSYFIEFFDHRDAAAARRQLKANSTRLFGSRCFICWEWQFPY